MTCETVYLRPEDKNVRLETYICRREGDMYWEDRKRDAVIVIPGGAYSFLAEREAEPCAKSFIGAGFNAFVLYYSLNERAKFPRPLQEISMAISHIHANADKYNIDPDRIFVCGFSAGGHLAGAIGTLWNRPCAAFEGMEPGQNRPCGMILCYPVITLGEYAHQLSRNIITGTQDPTQEQIDEYSLEKQVGPDTVPAFIWQTQEDNCVDIRNTLMMVNALVEAGIPTEYHMFPFGPHGMSIATEDTRGWDPATVDPHVANWVHLAIEWSEKLKHRNSEK